MRMWPGHPIHCSGTILLLNSWKQRSGSVFQGAASQTTRVSCQSWLHPKTDRTSYTLSAFPTQGTAVSSLHARFQAKHMNIHCFGFPKKTLNSLNVSKSINSATVANAVAHPSCWPNHIFYLIFTCQLILYRISIHFQFSGQTVYKIK